MKVVDVLKRPQYFLLAAVSAVAMLAIYTYTQLLGILQNFDVWIAAMPWYNAVLLSAFTLLFGITLSFQVYTWKQPKTCCTKGRKLGSAGTGSVGTFGPFLVAQCPACASLGALLLPVGVMGFVAQYSWALNLAAIGLLLFTLNYLGAFKK